jgi:hypothetical protein
MADRITKDELEAINAIARAHKQLPELGGEEAGPYELKTERYNIPLGQAHVPQDQSRLLAERGITPNPRYRSNDEAELNIAKQRELIRQLRQKQGF